MTAKNLPYRPCVGIMVINRAGLVWVGRRVGMARRPEGPNPWWQMPQGGIDEGEDVRAAGLRELAEETGMRTVTVLAESRDWVAYDLPAELVGRAWSGRFRGQKQKWLAVRHDGPESEIDITAPDGHEVEFDAWRWVQVSELVDLVVPFKRDTYRAVVDELGSYARPIT